MPYLVHDLQQSMLREYQYFFYFRINMYSEGLIDLMEMIMILPFTPPADLKTKLETIETKATGRYLPVFEKVP